MGPLLVPSRSWSKKDGRRSAEHIKNAHRTRAKQTKKYCQKETPNSVLLVTRHYGSNTVLFQNLCRHAKCEGKTNGQTIHS